MSAHPRYSTHEIVARAREIYERKVRSKVEAGNVGKYLVLDIESSDYEIDDDPVAASDRAHLKHPDGALYCLRIGYRSMGRIGFAPAGTRQ